MGEIPFNPILRRTFKKIGGNIMLLASAPTEEKIIKAISEFYYGSTVYLEGEKVFTLKGLCENMQVIKKKNRYRFERKEIKTP